ncbi:MAG: leucine-rich repeat protein [Bacteroidales bacterium]|nr:leucine-rich repeat protein [Bacteroidales bacterium]
MDKNLLQKAKAPMIALILFNLFAFSAIAQAQNSYGGGTGTYTDPYIISTTDHLDQLAANVNSGMEYQNVYFKLMDDLDYTGKTYTPIGNSYWEGGSESYHKFFGIFNGNNHSINNVTIYSEGGYCGLFGYVGWGGKIHNLTLGGQSTITAVGFAGGIAGVIDNAEIIGCNVGENVVISVHPRANNYSVCPGFFGGIVGASGGKVKDCISRATVSNGGIGKTEYIGGIAGALYNNLMEDCFFLGVVDATGSTNYVGDILGELSGSGQLVSNYYHTSNRHGGVDGNDTDNAKWMGTISCVSPVSGYGTLYVFNDGITRYFGANSFTWVVLNYNVEEGYLPCGITYMANDTIPLTNPNGNRYPLTMPDDDVVITGTVEAIKRDIGYSDWVSITIPEQDYTGEPLTPVVTVVDNKDGAALTLEEGTHYTVTLPDGGCVIPGYYNITITGMGDFAGQTTKTFTILNPGSGTEEDPYIIRNTDQMDGLAASVNGGDSKSGKFFRLETDLDYTGKTYTRIGIDGNRPFSGTFDGNGHTISHVTLNENDNFMGLFGYSRGTVKNLTLDDSSIHAERSGSVGGIVGFCHGGTVMGCYVTENVSISATGEEDPGGEMGTLIGGDDVGGIVGYAYYCTVSNCMNFAEVSGVERVGGVVGRNNNSTVTNNYYAGNSTVGGIGYYGSNSGSDVEGQAQRGYAIEPQQPLGISLEGSIGVFYDGKVYAGENQEAIVGFEVTGSSIVPQCLTLSAGTYADNDDGTYTITMPAEDITVSGNIVEQFGMFYEIPCNGDTTATLIHDDSYATIDAASVEDFEYQGTQYTVTEIADNAFDGCEHLKWFDCHSNILSIGDHAFRNCDSLEYVGLYEVHTPPTVGEGTFDGLGLDTLWLMVPFCSQYEYSQHSVWGQFGVIFPDGECQYNFIGMGSDQLWSTPENWAEGEVPVEGAQVGIMSDCEMDADVTVGSITIGGYYDEEYGCYEHLTVKDGATLTATSFIYNSGDARNFVIEDGAQVVHPNAGAKATVQKAVSAYSTQSGVNNGWHLIALPLTGSIDVDSVGNMIEGEYDLYAYDESTAYWKNSKNTENSFTALEATKGYLYAHGEDVTLEFSGTLQNSSATISVPLSYTTVAHLSGFNLVGNPFPCNAYLDREYYVLGENGTEISSEAIPSTVPIPPCTAVFVKAVDEGDSVVFTRVAP